MLNSAVLDVAIGMIFVFLVVSFGVTAGNELVSSVLKWRATTLATGIRRLVDDPAATDKLSDRLYQHALLRGLHRHEVGDSDRNKPSFIPAPLFATALLDLALKPAGSSAERAVDGIAAARAAITANKEVLGAHTTDALLALCDHAESDTRAGLGYVEKLRGAVEHWFDSSMDRVGGWYKRKTQLCAVLLALGIAVFVDVDSIRLARVLANTPVLRAALVAQASHAPAPQAVAPVGSAKPQTDEELLDETTARYQQLERSIDGITDLGIPMGWQSETSIPAPTTRDGFLWWLYKMGGLVLTAMAASLGAPFWFDLLRKLFGAPLGHDPGSPGAAPRPRREGLIPRRDPGSAPPLGSPPREQRDPRQRHQEPGPQPLAIFAGDRAPRASAAARRGRDPHLTDLDSRAGRRGRHGGRRRRRRLRRPGRARLVCLLGLAGHAPVVRALPARELDAPRCLPRPDAGVGARRPGVDGADAGGSALHGRQRRTRHRAPRAELGPRSRELRLQRDDLLGGGSEGDARILGRGRADRADREPGGEEDRREEQAARGHVETRAHRRAGGQAGSQRASSSPLAPLA